MKKLIKFALVSFAFLCTSLSIAAPVILKPITTPAPTEFSTVNGIIGLNSESLTGGTISVVAGSYSQTTPLEANGNFNLSVAANSIYTIKATLNLDATLPDVSATFKNYPALLQGETRTFDLRRPSGQLLGRVNVIGGTAQNISLFVNATSTTNGITEQYNANSNLNIVATQSPEVLLAFPASIISNVSGRVQITSTNGCILNESLPPKSIVLNDKASGTTNPDVLNWTVDVTGASCSAGSVNGEIRLDGLDTSVVLNQHQLSFIGPEFINLNLTTFGPYQVNPILEGEYGTSQTSFFNEPYSSLRYPNENVIVKGTTIFNTIYPVGTSHGTVQLIGDWNFSQTKTASIEASGTLPNSTSDSLSANDIIDPNDGRFDFILINGNWQANRYDFNFESIVNLRKDRETLKVELLKDSLANNHIISEGSSVNLATVSLNTAMAQIELLVEQTSGQSQITIDRLFINGNSNLIDPTSDTLFGKSSIRADSTGTPESGFQFTLYGLPGMYTLTARGTGSDGRTYSATFDVMLGNIPSPDEDQGIMACFGINKVKLHQHDELNKNEYSKDKLYIKYAGFRLPEDAIVDLAQDNVSITIDGKVYDFPAGTFKQHNDKQHYHYKSAEGQLPKVKVDIDFKKEKWSIKLNKEDTSYIDNSDGVDISLSIAGYTGKENVILKSKNKHDDKFMYKRKPKLDCRIKNKHQNHDNEKDDDDDDDESDNADNDS